MVKRKLDGVVVKSSVDQKIQMQLYITCEKSGSQHLAKPGLTAGWQASRQGDEIWARFEIIKAWYRLKYSLFSQGIALFQQL